MKRAFEPYQLVLLEIRTSTRKRPVQVISRLIPDHPEGDTIMVRMVPGDPTTIREVPIAKLEHYTIRNKKRWVHIAEVQGSFSFPEDMLRYDGAALCDPDQDEVPEGGWRTAGGVLIYAVSDRKQPSWTDARWRSFSWGLQHELTLDLDDHASDYPVAR